MRPNLSGQACRAMRFGIVENHDGFSGRKEVVYAGIVLKFLRSGATAIKDDHRKCLRVFPAFPAKDAVPRLDGVQHYPAGIADHQRLAGGRPRCRRTRARVAAASRAPRQEHRPGKHETKRADADSAGLYKITMIHLCRLLSDPSERPRGALLIGAKPAATGPPIRRLSAHLERYSRWLKIIREAAAASQDRKCASIAFSEFMD